MDLAILLLAVLEGKMDLSKMDLAILLLEVLGDGKMDMTYTNTNSPSYLSPLIP